jgi:hypothetical protein
MSSLKIVSPPAAEPIPLSVIKNHCRISIANDDQLVAIYAQAARELVESESGRSLVNKQYCQSHDRFPHIHDWTDRGTGYFISAPRYSRDHRHDLRQQIKLLRAPLVTVDWIEYIDTDGDLQTLDAAPELHQTSTEYVVGDQFQDENGNLQEVTAVNEDDEDETSESAATPPTWATTLDTPTTDGDLTCNCIAVPAPVGDFLVNGDSEPPYVTPLFGQVWPLTQQIPEAVKVFFTAGYGLNGDAAPATLRVALMQSTGVMYENREALTAEQFRLLEWYDRLIWSERVLDYDPTK